MVARGIHRLPVPTELAVGKVNAYLVEGDPLTLIDTGPPTTSALRALEQGLRQHGYALDDVELIVVTHQHADHVGLLGPVVERSGATVAALSTLAPYLGDILRARDDDLAVFEALMVRHGVPRAIAHRSLSAWRTRGARSQDVEVDRPFQPDSVVDVAGRSFRALHVPGHSPSDTLLYDQAGGVAFAGDHLLGGISSNALMCRQPDRPWDGNRPRPLLAYRESLRRTRALELRLLLTGHGEPVTDHRVLIDARLRAHETRARQVLAQLDHRPRTAHAVAQDLFGSRAGEQPLLTLSAVLGHADLLIETGHAEEVVIDGVAHLRTVGRG